jgi:dimethyl sulfoxide reductase iron-sulfur subunit
MITKHLVMVIDLQACIGCNTCTVACKQENNLPEGVLWTQVLTVGSNSGIPIQERPQELELDYLPLGCQHCASAPCLEVCPTSATSRHPETGVVNLDTSLCIGCRYCMMVCPYTGVRIYAGEQLRFSIPFPTGSNPILHRTRTVEKCTFCVHRLVKGLPPACVENCSMNARTFGDLNDPRSEVVKLLRSRPYFQLLPEKGTQPSVYYLI